jgi:predicted MFS family arabinose efflux permease
VLDTRAGYKVPIIVGVGVKIVIAGILGTVTSAVIFMATVPFFNAAMLLAVPYLQALMSLADPKGRFAAAAGASMTLGAALGAYLGGVTVTHLGLNHVGTVAIVMLVHGDRAGAAVAAPAVGGRLAKRSGRECAPPHGTNGTGNRLNR